MSTAIDPNVPQSVDLMARKRVGKGMVLMIIAMLTLPLMDGLAKLLALEYGVTGGQTAFGRFVVQAGLFLPIILVIYGRRALLPKRIAANLLRGCIMSLAVVIFMVTLRYMPIADAIAVFFLEPFFLTVLSALVLKEQVGWRRRIAVVVGFLGAMFIIQPSYAVFGPVSLMPIATAALFAVYLMLTRQIAGDDNPMSMQFVSGIGGVFTLGILLFVGTRLGVEDIAMAELPEFGIRWGLIFAIGALATFGHLLVVLAFRLASASVLAPFQYMEIVTATAIGYWLFDEFPDALKWVGIAIIVGSGIYLFVRERAVAEG